MRIAFSIIPLSILALVLAGCGDDSRTSGGVDSGTIIVLDSGAGDTGGRDITLTGDTGGGTDAGGGTDSGGTPVDCTVGAMGLAGADCFPRCSVATRSAVVACTTGECQQMAMAGDTTPPLTISGPTGMAAVDCAGCAAIQQNSCIAVTCPDQFQAFVMCSQMTGADCTMQTAALNECIMVPANMMTIQTCTDPRFTMCFPG